MLGRDGVKDELDVGIIPMFHRSLEFRRHSHQPLSFTWCCCAFDIDANVFFWAVGYRFGGPWSSFGPYLSSAVSLTVPYVPMSSSLTSMYRSWRHRSLRTHQCLHLSAVCSAFNGCVIVLLSGFMLTEPEKNRS